MDLTKYIEIYIQTRRTMRSVLPVLGWCLLSFYKVSSGLQQDVHSSLTQEGNVTCSKTGSEHLLRFELFLQSDTADIIYLVNFTDPTDVTADTFSSLSGNITGNGSDSNPYTFEIRATLGNAGFTFTEDDDTIKKGYSIGNDIIGVNVMVKSKYGAPFYHLTENKDDVLYEVVCDYTKVGDVIAAVGPINVRGNIDVNITATREVAQLNVINAQTNLSITSVGLGDPIALQLLIKQPSFVVGAYVKGCQVCDTADCNGDYELVIITPDGCTKSNSVGAFQLISEEELRTETFTAFAFVDKSIMFYRCTIAYCYKPNMLQCIDYCAYSKSSQRRKRQASTVGKAEELLSISLSVNRPIVNGEVVQEPDPLAAGAAEANRRKEEAEKQAQIENNTIVGTVGALCLAAFVVLVAGGACYLKSRRKKQSNLLETEQESSS